MHNWMVNQMLQVNLPTVLVSVCGSWGLREFVDWLKRRNLQDQQAKIQEGLQLKKAEIDKDLENTKAKYQQEIQGHYLMTQLKATSFYKAYPELHWALKEAEGAVYQLFFHSFGDQKKTYKIWCDLTQKLAEHSLFLDDALRDACIVAKDTLMEGILSHVSMDENAKKCLMQVIHEQIDAITNLFKACLLKGKV